MNNFNKSYCHLAYRHIFTSIYGDYNLCCKTHNALSPLSMYAPDKDLPFDVFFSEEMEQVRIDMDVGKSIPACEYCYKVEETHPDSGERNKWNQRIDDLDFLEYKQVTPNSVDLKMKIYGSYCNLECFMCTPENSSSRRKVVKRTGLEGFDIGAREDNLIITADHFDKIIDNIIDNIIYVRTIELSGGEPLMLPRVFKLLDRIPEVYAQRIYIHFSSNFTTIEYKGKDVNEYFKKFRGVECQVSLDHYEDAKLNWIRYPIDPNVVKRNLTHAVRNYNWDIKLSNTATILSIEDFDDTVDYWVNNFGVRAKGHHSVAVQDLHSVKNHPSKKNLYPKHDEGKHIAAELSKPFNAMMYNKAIEYWDILDRDRGTDWRKLWPHLKPIEMIKMNPI